MRAGIGAELVRDLADNIEIVHGLQQRLLVGVRNQVTALAFLPGFQRVTNFRRGDTAQLIPERGAIRVGSDALFGFRGSAAFRFLGDRRVHRRGKLAIDGRLSLQTLHLMPERDHIVFHTFVGSAVLRREDAILLMGIQEILGVTPEFGALFAQFHDLTHCVFPPANQGLAVPVGAVWVEGVRGSTP